MPCPARFSVRAYVQGLARAVSAPRRSMGGLLPSGPITAASLAGSGTLRGWSGYRPTGNVQDASDLTAPWNSGPVRKWLSKSLSGYLRAELYTETGLGGDLICLLPASFPIPAAGSYGDTWSGTVSIDPASGAFTSYGSAVARDYGTMPWTGACDITEGAPGNVTGLDGGGYDATDVFSLTTRARVAAGYSEPDNPGAVQWASRMETGLATETLSSPDSEYAALDRSGVAVAGALTEAISGTYAATAPGSTDPLGFTDAVAVRVSAPFTGLSLGETYTVRAWLRLRSLTGGADTTTFATSSFTPSASTCEVPFDLPSLPGYGATLVHLDLLEP